MSRTVPAGLQTPINLGTTRFVWGLRIVRSDSEVYAITSASRTKVVDTDTTYQPGLEVKSLVQSAGFSVDNTELQIIDVDDLTRSSILAGRWDAAAFTLSLFDWSQPTAGELVMMTGTLGGVRPQRGHFVAELRDLRQALQQETTDVVQPECRYRLGDAKCTVDLIDSDGLFTVNGTVTSSADRYHVTDTSRTDVDDWFGAGEILFNTGLNAGLRFLVSEYNGTTDTFTLALPTPFTVTAGDTYTAIVGCRKRAEEDCRDKFDNIINFGGEPHKARVDKILAGAT
jgi:uncharacterized phage protein (TIGR02218 family)